MIVTRIRLVHFRVPFRAPYLTAAGTTLHREGVIVQLQTDTGVVGYGESSLLPHDFGAVEAFVAEVESVARRALGATLEEVIDGVSTDHNAPASAGIEIAAWDALAHSRGLPLARLLSDAPASAVAVNALITGVDASAVSSQAKAAAAAGFRTLKLKVGIAATAAAERERVAAARTAIGPDRKLRLDANGAWDEARALEVLEKLTDYDIEYVEQPLAPHDLAGLARLRSRVQIPIALDESVLSVVAAQLIIACHAADVLVLKPIVLGGIGPTRKIAQGAYEAGLGVVVTTSIDSGVGTAAALHLAASLAQPRAHGLATLDLLEDGLVTTGLPIVVGCMALPAAPGLGVDLDEPALARYAVRDWTLSA